MNLFARIVRASAIVVVALVAALVGTAAPASASGCYAYTCHGYDVNYMGCAVSSVKSTTAYVSGTAVAVVENRYSSGCRANWGRAWLTSAGLSRGYKIYVDIWTNSDSKGNFEYMCYPGPSNTGQLEENCDNIPMNGYGGSQAIYGDMVDGTNLTTARVWVISSSNGYLTNVSVDQ